MIIDLSFHLYQTVSFDLGHASPAHLGEAPEVLHASHCDPLLAALMALEATSA